ncbi:MAG: HD domain-containing protein [Clostridiales bacterium]|nr:HD domain-containing protein [Clostridiales bacterium]
MAMKRKETIKELFNQLDSTTYNHSIRVMALAMEYEEFIGIDNHLLSQAALVHDIGKIYVSSKILDKTGSLSCLEHHLVDLHPYIGYSLLKERNICEDLSRVVLYHHGYLPSTLTEITRIYENKGFVDYCAKVLRTIDAFEALTSDRPYHRGISAIDATYVLKKQGFDDNDGFFFLTKTAFNTSNDYSAVQRGNCLSYETSADKILNDWENTNCA